MRDLDRWKDKVELQLDGRQIFFLFFGSAICACLIFVLGVVVGRRVESQRSMQAPATAEDPLAVLDELGNAEEGLTFHSALLKDKEGRKKGEAKAEPRVEAPAKAEKAEPADREDDAARALGKAEAAKAEAAKADAAKGGEAPKGADKAKAEEARADKGDKDKRAVADKAAAKGKAADKARAHFTLQLSAFATKAEANEFMRKLRDAGYKPYLAESLIPGKGLMYRVRLGDYPSRDSALSAKSDFERKQKMVAYVAKL